MMKLSEHGYPLSPHDDAAAEKLASFGISTTSKLTFAELSLRNQRQLNFAKTYGNTALVMERPFSKEKSGQIIPWLGVCKPIECFNFSTNYHGRFVAATLGLWGNVAQDAMYVGTSGHGSMTITVNIPPPVRFEDFGFWSITVYGTDLYAIENGGQPYAVGSKQLGDGLPKKIYISPESNRPDNSDSWISTGNQSFYIVLLRLYQPTNDVINETYVMPTIERQWPSPVREREKKKRSSLQQKSPQDKSVKALVEVNGQVSFGRDVQANPIVRRHQHEKSHVIDSQQAKLNNAEAQELDTALLFHQTSPQDKFVEALVQVDGQLSFRRDVQTSSVVRRHHREKGV